VAVSNDGLFFSPVFLNFLILFLHFLRSGCGYLSAKDDLLDGKFNGYAQAPGSASSMSFVEDFKDAYHVPFTVGTSPGLVCGAHSQSTAGGSSAAASLHAATTPGAPRGSAPAVVSLAPPSHILESPETGLVGRKHIITPRAPQGRQQPACNFAPQSQELGSNNDDEINSAGRSFGI
jgi:hypothetical protein